MASCFHGRGPPPPSTTSGLLRWTRWTSKPKQTPFRTFTQQHALWKLCDGCTILNGGRAPEGGEGIGGCLEKTVISVLEHLSGSIEGGSLSHNGQPSSHIEADKDFLQTVQIRSIHLHGRCRGVSGCRGVSAAGSIWCRGVSGC